MRSIKLWQWAAIGIASLSFLAWVYYKTQFSSNIPGPSAADWAAVVKARDIHRRAIDVDSAMHGCEQWINTHSKAGVNKIVARYELTGKPVKLKREYWVAVDYREKAKGPLMQGSCHYVGIVGNVVLLEAKTVRKY
ncbi:MAG TPA: hypothetical protein VG028_03500 [Terriglobia bacterium]|nr:hypothetical protein [Terriglobia bacterium]